MTTNETKPESPKDPIRIYGLKSRLIKQGDDICGAIKDALDAAGLSLSEGDVIVIAESVLATAEGNVVRLDDVTVSRKAEEIAAECGIDAREAELVIREADRVLGGVSGAVLTLKNGLLCPNAGIDNSNAPAGYVTLYPKDPNASARKIMTALSADHHCRIGVIIADSRTQPLRMGCTGVAIGAAGFSAVEDRRGDEDLFGRKMLITRVAVADNLATAAEIVMGETNASVPFALIRGASVRPDPEASGIETIPADQCLYFGSFRSGFCGPDK